MTHFFPILLILSLSSSVLLAQQASGIKTANLKGADLDLLNNHDPASELENFELMDGYEINLFAADPMLANPIHMVWDSRGRLWVACSWAYPQIKPGDVANDKIIILEDTDNDGAADKSTVFADGLYLPTGIELANGGCYVGQSPDIYFLKDTDGDDVADVKELALTGFGIEDNHHSISAWRRGPGGWIYFQEGIFLHAQVETQHGLVRNYNGGVYQFNPRTGELKVFVKGTGGNPWGHVFDKWGQSFMVNNPRIMYLSPSSGAFKENTRVAPLISTEKQCGGDLVTGTHLPDELQGQLLTCRFKSRSIIRYEFIEDGAGYSANVLEPLVTSKHPNFRPVDCKIGPDGAIYVADWYNSIINHAQHDFRDPRRDHEHGRIWRITHKDRPLAEKPKLYGATIDSLVSQLGSPEAWTRHQARKELSERNPDQVLAAVENWASSLNSNSPDYAHGLVESMWACQNVERASEMILTKIIQSDSPHARSAGARVIRYWHDQLSDPVGMIAKLADDPFPRTRMEAVLSAGFIPEEDILPALLNVLNHERDKFINAAIPSTMAALESEYIPALENDSLNFFDPKHRLFAEQSAGLGLDKRLISLLRESNPSTSEINEVAKQFSANPTAKLIRILVNAIGKGGLPSDEAVIGMLNELQKIGAKGNLKPGRYFQNLLSELTHPNDEVAAGVAASLGSWQYREGGENLLNALNDKGRSSNVRSAAAVSLAQLGQTQYVNELKALAESGDIETRYHAVTGLAVADMDDAKVAVASVLSEDPGKADPVALVQSFTKIRRGDGILADALTDVAIHPKVMSAVATFHRQTGQLPNRLWELFLEPTKAALSALLLKQDRDKLTFDVDRYGVAARGEMIFRRPEVACISCHGIGSVGPTLGPNLVAVGTAASTSYIIEAILEPNASIAEHYENLMFAMTDGTNHMGVISFQNEQEVIIQDSAQGGKEIALPVANIAQRTLMPSLMPAGLADQLNSRQEFLDLAKFLSLLGQPGPYANTERPFIRKWHTAPATSNDLPSNISNWTTVYSQVNGELPFIELGDKSRVFAQGFVNVQVGGQLILDLNDTKGLQLWVNGESKGITDTISLPKGNHSITFAIEPEKRNDTGLLVELKAAAGSSIKFQPEGGI